MATLLDTNAVDGLDQRQLQALKQANIDTVEKLAAIDPDAIASKTGLAAEDLRRLKAQASAPAQREAKAPPARRTPAVAYLVLALILITAVSLLYAFRVRAGARALTVEQEQQLIQATAHVASIAQGHVDAAAFDVGAGNWGLAQRDLGRVGDEVTVLEQIAPRKLRPKVGDIRSGLGRAQEAVGAQDRSALERIDHLKLALAKLSGAGEEKSD